MANAPVTRTARPDPATARQIRERFGWSRQRMAEELRVHETSVIRWEQGAGGPSGYRLEDWVALLDRMTRELARSA